MKKAFLTKLFFFLALILFGQSPPQKIKFRHLSLEDGLSQGSIYSILQDKEGFMWFGTEEGLNKYDGYKFTVYRHDPNDASSISSGSIFSICEDKDGTLWIGTDNGGLNSLDKKTGKFRRYQNDPDDSTSLGSNRVFNALVDRDGILWICAYGGGLNRFDKATGKFTRYKHKTDNINSLSNNNVRSIYEDNDGTLWIGTYAGGLNAFDKNTGKFTAYMYENTKILSVLQDNSILCIASDERGTIWAGTFGGEVITLNKITGKFSVIKRDSTESHLVNKKSISSIYRDNNGIFWIGTLGEGVVAISNTARNSVVYKNDPLDIHSLRSNIISRIYQDRSGVLWIGTMGSGLDLFDTKGGKILTYKNNPYDPNSLSNNNINAICEGWNGLVWVGTSGGGINGLFPENKKIIHYKNNPLDKKSINDNNIGSLYEDKEGVLWAGTHEGGLNSKEKNSASFRKYQNNPSDVNSISTGSIKVLFEDKNGTIWIGMRGTALNSLDKKNMKFKQYLYNPLDSNTLKTYNLRCFFEDHDGAIWIGTRGGGLYRLDKETDKFRVYKNDSSDAYSLNNNSVMGIYQDEKNTLWLGTFGGGLNAMVREKDGNVKFYNYTEKDGLPNNVIYGILPDAHGNLWLSTNNGICKFTPPRDFNASSPLKIHSYDVNDGLPTNEFNSGSYCKTRNGWMYFGCSEGLVAFHPDSLKDNSHIPPVYITSFKVFEKEFPSDTSILYKKSITLSYSQSFFSFEFTGLDYSLPMKNQYAYKMEGFDKDWIYSGHRRYASYTNLDPGNYIFHVKASNNDGVWNEQGTELNLIITPPWWKTWWFRISVLLVTIFSVIFYIRWRESSLRAQKEALEQKVNERTLQLKEEKEKVERQKIIVEEKNQNITDSINYAKRIQTAILPAGELFKQLLPQSFVLYQPKDIISGDFYWIAEKEEHVLIAVADCTGHGVPGALMSMVGSSLLHQIVNEKTIKNPPDVLAELDKQIIRSLKQKGVEGESREGMDISFVEVSKKRDILRFSGANRPIYFLNNGELKEIEGSKHPIGSVTRKLKIFDMQFIALKEGDSFYIFSDGFCDQFGGTKNKKFMTRRLKEVLLAIHQLPMEMQKEKLIQTINEWKGNVEQVDDICIIGVRI